MHRLVAVLLPVLLPAFRDRFDTAAAVFRRTNGRWRLSTVGTVDVGCVIHDADVRANLGLDCAGR